MSARAPVVHAVTIARQLGAGGADVARGLADALGWRLLDRSLVERIAAELRVTPELVESCDERVETFVERLGMYLSEGYPEVLPIPVLPPVSPERTARAARRVVAEAVGEAVGEGPAVIVGHGSQCVLRDDPRAFHVLVYAPFTARVERVRARFGVGAEEAEARVRRSDADRRGYIREHFDSDWLDPTLYHLCVDSGRLGTGPAAELIGRAVRTRLAGA